MKKYIIIQTNTGYYRVQHKFRWWPFWIETYPFYGNFHSMEKAEEMTLIHSKEFEKWQLMKLLGYLNGK